jgi:cellulose synthase operon protein YhjQ
MKTVAIVSLKGGVGKTTTAANLGAALARKVPGGVLLVDCDPRNQLGIHFGLGGDVAGLAQMSLRRATWARATHEVGDGITCLPFGTPSHAEVRDFETLVARQPELMREGLDDPALEHLPLAVIDAAPWPSQLLETVLRLADLVVIVLLADPASFATLPSLHELLHQHPRADAHVLINGVDGTRLARDVRAVISAQPPVPVLPFAVHRDQAVPEALARQRPVVENAPSSQAAADFRCAAEWVMDALAAEARRSEASTAHSEGSEASDVPLASGASE